MELSLLLKGQMLEYRKLDFGSPQNWVWDKGQGQVVNLGSIPRAVGKSERDGKKVVNVSITKEVTIVRNDYEEYEDYTHQNYTT